MIFSSTDIDAVAEAVLRDAASALRCGPLPRECRAATPVPIGRPGIVCSTTIDVRAVNSLGETVVAIAAADLTALQRDLLWDRAFDLSWKEIEAKNPGIGKSTLRLHHHKALAEFATALRRRKK